MIKRLRRRFIIVNMTILTCVLFGILGGIFTLMYSSEVKTSYDIMEQMLKQPDRANAADISYKNTYLQCSNYEDPLNIPLAYGDEYYDDYRDDYNHNDDGFNEWGPRPQPPHPWFPEEPGVPDFPPETTAVTKAETKSQTTAIAKTTKPAEKTTTKSKDNNNTVNKTTEKKQTTLTETTAAKSTKAESKKNTTTASKSTSATTAFSRTKKPDAASTPPPMKPGEKREPKPFVKEIKRASIYVKFNSLDDINAIIYNYCENEDNESVKKAVQTIVDSGKNKGTISVNTTHFRYLLKDNTMHNLGFELILLDRTIEISTVNKLLFIFIIIGSIGLIVIFGLSVILANWTIKPVEKAWDQQKQFVADASHELKTPLTVISANTDVILASPEDLVKNQTKWLNYIKTETTRMSKLVTNLLCIAKYDANQIKTIVHNFDLSNVISSICLLFEPLAFENGKILESGIQPNISFNGDEDKIKQLINILLDNALKYSSDNGKILVSLSTDKQNKVCIDISNSSDTIPKEKLDKIFDRFYRIDDSRNRKTGGSGLGLNIAKTIVENHHGTISVKSENNVTTFHIVL